jgi:hypothetical protein
LGLDDLVQETQKVGMYPIMLPAPTRMDWHNFMLGFDQVTIAASRDEARGYYDVYPERAITTSLATRALMNKETTHYIQQYMAAQQLVISRAVNVLNVARLSGILYSQEAAATLRFSTFNTLLRSLQGTPMTSWVYDSIFNLAKNFINVSSESGIVVLFPYFLNPEDEWFDLPTIFGSVARPVGGVTRRPPVLHECVDSGEFVASGTFDSGTHAALTDPQTIFPENLYSGVPAKDMYALKYYDMLMDWLIAELAAAINNFKTKFMRNSNKKLNIGGTTASSDTVIWWTELGVLNGQFDSAQLFNDVNGIELFDYSSLADQPERNMDGNPSPAFARAPGSEVAADADHGTLSRWLLRPFVFDATAETYPGEYRIAFDLDDDQYWEGVKSEHITAGYVTSIPLEFPYAGIACDSVAEINALIDRSTLPTDDTNLLGTVDPGTPAKTGLVSQIIKEKLLRYGDQADIYVSPEDKGAIAAAINSDDNVYISNAMLDDGLFLPMWKKYPTFNPHDPYQHGEFLILSVGDSVEWAREGSWEAALSTTGAFNSDVAWVKGSKMVSRGVSDANITLPTDDVPWSVEDFRTVIGLAWVFVGDAIRLTPSLHFRRKDIAFLSSVATEDLYTKGSACPIPVRPHTVFEFNRDLSFHATDMALEGITVASGVYTIDYSDESIGLQDPAILDLSRVTLSEQYFLPGYFPSTFAPVKEETLFGVRALEGRAQRAAPDMSAVLSPLTFSWNGKAPLASLAIQGGMLVTRRSKDNKAGGNRDESSSNSSNRSANSSSKGGSSKKKKKKSSSTWIPDDKWKKMSSAEKKAAKGGESSEAFNPESMYTDKAATDAVKTANKPGEDDDYRTAK